MLKGKKALITGASRGIGRAIALSFAENGADIFINYASSSEEAEKLAEEIRTMGRRAEIFRADVSDFSAAEEMVSVMKKTMGSVDILVNNAGITRDNLVLRMSEEDFDDVLRINLKGSFNCSKHAGRIMLKQKQGKIINISSVVGITGNAGQVNYSASKAGILGMTKSFAREFAPRGINVNALAPGFIATDMTDRLSEDIREKISGDIPLGKMGTAEDVAKAALFLASDLSSYITGQTLSVDGGMVMQ